MLDARKDLKVISAAQTDSSSQSSQTNVGGRVQVSFCTAWEAIHGYDDSCVNCAYKRGNSCGNSVASLTTM